MRCSTIWMDVETLSQDQLLVLLEKVIRRHRLWRFDSLELFFRVDAGDLRWTKGSIDFKGLTVTVPKMYMGVLQMERPGRNFNGTVSLEKLEAWMKDPGSSGESPTLLSIQVFNKHPDELRNRLRS